MSKKIVASNVTEGHRFMGAGKPFEVTDFADYRTKLERNFVVLSFEDRKAKVLEGAKAVCAAKGLELVDDIGLLDEVAGLAEWPTPILGDMAPEFLALPPEVVRLSMKVHQKYFAVRTPGAEGLAPHYVVVANIEAADGGKALAAGNSKVLSARLNDGRFFWEEDQKVGFDAWNAKLSGVTFHAKLGTPPRSPRWSVPMLNKPKQRPVCARPIWLRAWSASSLNCKALWAAITPVWPDNRTLSPTPSAITTSRKALPTACRPHR